MTRPTQRNASSHPVTTLLCLVVCFVCGTTSAQHPSLGVALAPLGGSPTFSVTGTWPIVSVETSVAPVHVLARADVAASFAALTSPAFALGVGARLETPSVEPYTVTSVGVGWRSLGDERSAVATWSLAAGARVPIDERWSVRVEALAAPLQRAFGVALGVDWAWLR